jgi:hypothetical protein
MAESLPLIVCNMSYVCLCIVCWPFILFKMPHVYALPLSVTVFEQYSQLLRQLRHSNVMFSRIVFSLNMPLC